MELCEMIKVMQHYENGGEVEYIHNNVKEVFGKVTRKHDGDLKWNWYNYTYKIKKQKQKVTIQKWLCRDKHGDFLIFETSNVDKYILHEKVKLLESYEVEL